MHCKRCHVHYTKAIWRFVAKRGLLNRSLFNADFRRYIRYFMVLPILRSMSTRRVHNKLQQKNRSICSMVDWILIDRSMEFRPSPPDSKASSARRWSVETGPRFTMANFNCFSSVELLVLRQRQSCRRSSSPIMLRAGVCSSTLRGTARVTTAEWGLCSWSVGRTKTWPSEGFQMHDHAKRQNDLSFKRFSTGRTIISLLSTRAGNLFSSGRRFSDLLTMFDSCFHQVAL